MPIFGITLVLYMLKLLAGQRSATISRSNRLSVEELTINQSETYWVKQNQKNLKSSLESGQLRKLDPLTDSEGILRLGERLD